MSQMPAFSPAGFHIQLELFKRVHRRHYMHPSTLTRTFLGLRTAAELKHILFGGWQLARMEMLKADSRNI